VDSAAGYSRTVVPLRILLRPNHQEHERFRDEYEALAQDLEGEGVLVRLLPVADQHSVPAGTSPAEEQMYDLEIQVGSSAEEIVGTTRLIELVRRRLRGREKRAATLRRVKVFLASGEEHEFSFASDE
jgi:hypothetical protein